jgi:hypothetical protein
MTEAAKSIFQDKTYQELDFITQAVEPFLDPAQDLLTSLPDKIQVSAASMAKAIDYGTAYAKDIIRATLQTVTQEVLTNLIVDSFDIQVNREQFQLNIVSGEFEEGVEVFVVKNRNHIPDQELLTKAIETNIGELLSSWNTVIYKGNSLQYARLKALAELLEAEGKSRSNNELLSKITSSMSSNLLSNKWRIKSTIALETLAGWVKRYVESEDYPAYASIAKFKVMVHRGNPIYSLEEIE